MKVIVLVSDNTLANTILIVHFMWAIWMIVGIILAYLGFIWHRLWSWKYFRISHLVGLIATSTTPLWADGICPLTEWEWQLRYSASSQAHQTAGKESFVIQWIREMLFVDISPLTLSIITGFLALSTVIIFIMRPPWRNYR